MRVVLDTNVLSEVIKPVPNASVVRMLLSAPRRSLFASEVTRYELRVGALRHPRPEHLWARIHALVLPLAEWMPVDARISEQAAEIDTALARKGRLIGAHDPFIAGTALVLGCPVVTRNARHFELVRGLEVINWHLDV